MKHTIFLAAMLCAAMTAAANDAKISGRIMDANDKSAVIGATVLLLQDTVQIAGTTSVAQEEGVICIFPMQVKDMPTTIRIVEIYRDEAAYQAHLLTPHFLEHKQGTLHMVKSLHLVPVNVLAPEAMPLIFEKLKRKMHKFRRFMR